MNILKKTTLCALAALTITAGTGAYAATFSDMPSGQMGLAIENAVNNGLIGGYEDGTVKPNEPITRAQMATIITRAFGTKDNADVSFGDVTDNAWYKDAVEKAVYMGAFKGDEKGNFNPENNITFQETYTVLARVFQYEPRKVIVKGEAKWIPAVDDNALSAFADANSVADWAKDYAKALVANGGYTGINGKLQGTAQISRGQFAMIMDELVSLYIDQAGTYTTGFGEGAVVVRSGDVVIDGINTTKNIIVGYGVESKTEIKNIKSTATVVVLGGRDRTPVETTNSKGEKILKADEILVSVQGELCDVRIMSPSTTVSIRWTNENAIESVFLTGYHSSSVIDLGFIG